jgi:hypothetical protein
VTSQFSSWRMTPQSGTFFKDISLMADSHEIVVFYGVQSGQLFVRHGLSPNLQDLLLNGQKHLFYPPAQDFFMPPQSGFHVLNRSPLGVVRTSMLTKSTNSFRRPEATDRDAGANFDTINMRNLAQTQQTEFLAFSSAGFGLLMESGQAITIDGDADGLPDGWELTYGFDITSGNGVNGGGGDFDGDGRSNLEEYVFGANPTDSQDAGLAQVTVTQATPSTRTLTYPTRVGRNYRVQFTNNLGQSWQNVPGSLVLGNGNVATWTDDGTNTGSPPNTQVRRFYRVAVSYFPH